MTIISYIKDTFKSRQKTALIRVTSLLIATILLFMVAVWAWFVINSSAKAEGLQMVVGTSKNLQLSLDEGKTYHNGLDLFRDTAYVGASNKLDNLKMRDITSDGLNFLSPKFIGDANRVPDCTQNWSVANANQAYISQTILFKTTFPAEIYIGAETAITTSDSPLTGTSLKNPADNANFSKDCIVGALRLSAIDSSNNHLFTMIPRPDVELVDTDGTFSVNTGNAVSQTAKQHWYYSTSYMTEGAPVQYTKTMPTFTATDDSKPSSTVTKIADTVINEDGEYIATATINIWLEGCDAETRRVLSGGKYSIVLDFVAYEVEE